MIPRLSFRLGIELRGVAIHIYTFLEGDQIDYGATYTFIEQGSPKEDLCMIAYLSQGVSVWEGAEEVQNIIHIKAEWRKMKLFQGMQLIQKLCHDQKCMKKVFEVIQDLFWGKIMQDFNNGTYQGARTKNMIMGVGIKRLHDDVRVTTAQEAIKNRFGGNKESKKMQKTILKQNYENFPASSQERLDETYDSLEHIALIIRNKYDLDTLSMDDLYNNLKVYEFEIKSQSSSSINSQIVAFVSSDNSSSTNEIVNTAYSVSAASFNDQASTGSYADDIDTNDLEEMDLKWQVAMLTMRVKRFIKKTRRKLDLNGKETVWFDRTKVECYNYHRIGHFARECMTPRNSRNRNRDAPTKNAPMDTSTTNALSELLDNVFDSHESDGDDNQVNDRFKRGEGYHAVLSSYTRNYMPSRADLSFAGLDNFVFKSKVSENIILSMPKIETNASKTSKDSLEKLKTVRNTTVEIENKAEKPRKFSQSPRGKITGPKEIRPVWDNTARVNHQNKLTHPHPKRNFVPTAVLIKSGQVPVNAAKQISHRAAASVSAARRVNTTASRPNVNNAIPTTYSYFKTHSLVRRPFNKKLAAKTNNFNEKVNTFKVNNVTTTRPKAVVSAVEGNRNNAVKNKSYLIDYQEIDGGFVAFGGNAKGGKFISKGKIRTGKLDFEDVYFVKELKFNLFSVSQMYDKKYNVLFTDIECVVLSPDFKLLNESQILLKDETPEILKNLIAGIENQMDHKVKTIRCDNGTEFKNRIMNKFYEMKGYSINSKAFRVFNTRTKFVEEKMHINFLENKPNVTGTGPNWIFDIDTLTMSMNYQPVFKRNQTNGNAGPKSSEDQVADDAGKKRREKAQRNKCESMFGQDKDANGNMMFTPVSAAGSTHVNLGGSIPVNAATLSDVDLPNDPLMPNLEDITYLQDT
nr:hypothetical protein [Tanacetum cinerariifolium]